MTNCDTCNKENASLRCSRCSCYYYCNKDCQKVHWKKEHKIECSAIIDNITKTSDNLNKAKLISEKITNLDDNCCICLEPLTPNTAMLLKCFHMLCKKCIFNLPEKEIIYNDDEVSREAPSCPICRTELPLNKNLMQHFYDMAVLLIQRANKLSREFDINEILLLCQQSRTIINNIEEFYIENNLPIDNLTKVINLLSFETYYTEGKYNECINIGNELLKQNIFDNDKMHIYVEIAQCYIMLNDYINAKITLFQSFEHFNPSDRRSPHKVLLLLCQVCYELHEYDKAIQAGEEAIKLNRFYDNSYKYIALSYKELGDIDNAIKVMKRALLYETPWDEKNKLIIKLLHDNLINEKSKLNG